MVTVAEAIANVRMRGVGDAGFNLPGTWSSSDGATKFEMSRFTPANGEFTR